MHPIPSNIWGGLDTLDTFYLGHLHVCMRHVSIAYAGYLISLCDLLSHQGMGQPTIDCHVDAANDISHE